MRRRAARGDVAAALLHAGSIAVALLRVGYIDAALLHTGSIAVALLRTARALSVQKRYASEWDVQKRHGSEQGGGRCGGRGVSEAGGVATAARRIGGERGGTARGTARRAGRCSEGNGAARGTVQRGEWLSETWRIGSEKRPRAGTRGRLGSACGDTTLRVETRARGHAASWTTCWDTTAWRF